MKKTQLLILALLLTMTLSACEQTVNIEYNENDTKVGETKVENTIEPNIIEQNTEIKETKDAKSKETDTVEKNDEIYLNWIIRYKDNKIFSKPYDRIDPIDCIDFTDAMYYKDIRGDIMSSLIVDDDFRELFKLDVYTKKYVKSVEAKISDKMKEMYGTQFFFARSACHAEGVDAFVGLLKDQGMFYDELKPNATPQKVVVFVHKDDVWIFNDDAILAVSTASGQEPHKLCEATFESDQVKWKCLTELVYDDDNFGEKYHIYTLKDGKIVSEETITEYRED